MNRFRREGCRPRRWSPHGSPPPSHPLESIADSRYLLSTWREFGRYGVPLAAPSKALEPACPRSAHGIEDLRQSSRSVSPAPWYPASTTREEADRRATMKPSGALEYPFVTGDFTPYLSPVRLAHQIRAWPIRGHSGRCSL